MEIRLWLKHMVYGSDSDNQAPWDKKHETWKVFSTESEL